MCLENFFDFNFADILGILLSLASMFAALRIPRAITTYKIEADMLKNVKEMRNRIASIRETVLNGNLSASNFISQFNSINVMLEDYTQYMDFQIRLKQIKLNFRYNRLIEEANNNSIDGTDAIKLLDEYSQFINKIKIKVGGK